LGDAPGSRQPPFGVGISVSGPIYPVMDSCYLSAGNVRFLILPVPTEEFSFPHGWLTSGIDRPLDLIGIATFRMCEMQLGRSALSTAGNNGCPFPWKDGPRRPVSHSSPFQPFTVTSCHAALSGVQLPSSFQSSPGPVASFGSKLPWTLPLAFHLIVASDAERD